MTDLRDPKRGATEMYLKHRPEKEAFLCLFYGRYLQFVRSWNGYWSSTSSNSSSTKDTRSQLSTALFEGWFHVQGSTKTGSGKVSLRVHSDLNRRPNHLGSDPEPDNFVKGRRVNFPAPCFAYEKLDEIASNMSPELCIVEVLVSGCHGSRNSRVNTGYVAWYLMKD